MKKQIAGCLTAAVIAGISSTAWAAEPTVAEQEAEIAALKARLAVIETQLKSQEQKQHKTEQAMKKKAGNDIKMYGDARVRAVDSGDGYDFTERVRINLEKKINKDTIFRMRDIIMNENEMGESGDSFTTSSNGTLTNTSGKDTHNKIDNAYLLFNRVNGDKNTSIKVGRFGHSFGTTGYWSSAGSLGMYDGLELTTGNKLKVSVGFGDWGGAKDAAGDKIRINSNGVPSIVQGTDTKGTTANKLEKNVFIKLGYKTSPATNVQAWHIRETNADSSPLDYEVSGIGFKSKLNNKLALAYDYSRNAAVEGAPVGQFATLTYGNADYNKPHSWESRLYYANVDKKNVASPLNKSINIPCNDNRGIGLSMHYVISKNVMAEFLTEFDMTQKSTGKKIDDYYRFQISAKF